MAGNPPASQPRQTLCGPPPGTVDTDDVSEIAKTAAFDHAAEQSVLQFDREARYRIVERIGAGGFGVVFKAWDSQLERTVAIKVLKSGAGEDPAAALLAEARTLAKLDHSAIVPVYDLGRTVGGELLIVSKFIDGSDLKTWLKSHPMTTAQAAHCVAVIAEALDYAHSQGIVHRDVKPGNILLTSSGEAVLSDFGLALHEHAIGTGNQLVGTPAYMSPEQARSEGHRVDGRSDIYSLGTVFYELLTGQRPFLTQNREELLDFIRNVEVRPPRQIRREIPRELERICLKALAKRSTERYSTAGDMADELREFVRANQESVVSASSPTPPAAVTAEEPSSSVPIVVPHGLRSFDEADADFFHHLLPGARDREGVPESVRFWTRRIEATDPGEAFRVGVLLGPSGSGKSSLLRAGILPLVADNIETILVDAGSVGVEDRLRRRLARLLGSEDADQLSLHDLLVRLRRQGPVSGRSKILIVIDQFEQWLNQNDGREHTELAEALRQCDGSHLQTILVVRDDFTIPTTRFLEELEEPLLQNRNFAAIDRFSPQHAAKVLEAFGRAYRIWDDQPRSENRRFIDLAIQELTRSGALIPVQLAALAEIIKDQPWTEATLKQLGGVAGIAVRFLEDRLVGPRSHPEIRLQLPLVRSLLEALLSRGTENENIRGPAKTRSQLLAALSGEITPQRLDKLLHLLDAEVRLITPVRSGGPIHSSNAHSSNAADSHDSANSQPEPAYQLTHDYLVPAIRAWLTTTERSTRKGRAHLRLKELAESWNARPTSKNLPTLVEWLTIRSLLRPAEWTSGERRMMQATSRRLALRGGAALAAITLISLFLVQAARYQRAKGLYASLLAADTAEVPALVAQLSRYDAWTLQRALQAAVKATRGDDEGELLRRRLLHQHLAAAASSSEAALAVANELEHISPEHLAAISTLLKPQGDHIIPAMWRFVNDATPGKSALRLPAACLLAQLDQQAAAWTEVASPLTNRLLLSRPAALPHYLKLLRPQRKILVPKLLALLERPSELTPTQRNLLFESLAFLADDDWVSLAIAVEHAEAQDIPIIWSSASNKSADLSAALKTRWDYWVAVNTPVGPVAAPPQHLSPLVARYSGAIGSSWAYVAACPRDEFNALSAALSAEGYSLVTLRPRKNQTAELVAAVFDRAGLETRWDFDVSLQAALDASDQASQNGWSLTDLATRADDPQMERFTLLWRRCPANELPNRGFFQVTSDRLAEITKELLKQGLVLGRCTSGVNPSGAIVYTVLFERPAATLNDSAHRSRYAQAFGHLIPSMALHDVRVHWSPPDQRDTYAAAHAWDVASSELKVAIQPALRTQALGDLAQYSLIKADPRAALEFCQQLPPTANNLTRHGTAAARLGNAEQLRQVIERLQGEFKAHNAALPLQIRLALLEGRLEDVPPLLQRLRNVGSAAEFILARCLALAGSSTVANENAPQQVDDWRAESLRVIQSVLERNASGAPDLLVFDPDFDGLRGDVQWQHVLRAAGLTRRFEAVWQDQPADTQLIFNVAPREHERLAANLVERGYRPLCIDAATDPGDGQTVLISAWSKPLILPVDSMKAARAQARLAAGLARLGDRELAIDVSSNRFGHEPRSQLLAVMGDWLPASQLIELLKAATNLEAQRSLLLALGEVPPSLQTSNDRASVRLAANRLAASGQPSLVSASDWCLRRWQVSLDHMPESASVATGQGPTLLNSLGQRLIVLDPPDRVLMGSPIYEPDRTEKDSAESLHWRHIGRRFAIAATETTVAAFREFQEDARVKKIYDETPLYRTEKYAPTPDSPQTSLRWYDAVRFCQWLSERERIPEAQWCYPNVLDQPPGKWTIPANFVARTGYRLPTEAEWEFACRAGATSAHYYGWDRSLLKQYAWCLVNGEERTHPVAQLMPNDFGLFDMLGNVQEWCHDVWGNYELPLNGIALQDAFLKSETVRSDVRRIMRGGSFETLPRQVRCADRSIVAPEINNYRHGFRIVRTVPARSETLSVTTQVEP